MASLGGMQPVQDLVKWVLLPACGTAWTICCVTFPHSQTSRQANTHYCRYCQVTAPVLTERPMTTHYGLSFDQQESGKATVL